ncbi:hypothetical protein N657DRAFT_544509, partial [Parathielavia appendiculata]
DTTPEVILSHTWGEGGVTFRGFDDGTTKNREDYKKIDVYRNQTAQNGFRFFWVDLPASTGPTNSKLLGAINSMFRWYQNAAECCVYLEDVS